MKQVKINSSSKKMAQTKKMVQMGLYFSKLGFPPCKAQQPLWGIELQENKVQKD